MKQKINLLVMIIFLSSSLLAQKPRFGLTGGISMAKWVAKSSGLTINSNSIVGINAGVTAFFPINSNFSLQSGLNFIQKGAKPTGLSEGEEDKIKLNYLELPFNVLFNKNGFFVGAGPTFSYGLSGKEKYSYQGNTEETKISFGNSEEDDLKAFDLGANITAGYLFSNHILISANYNWSLTNLMPGSTSSDGKLMNRYAGIKIGYIFN